MSSSNTGIIDQHIDFVEFPTNLSPQSYNLLLRANVGNNWVDQSGISNLLDCCCGVFQSHFRTARDDYSLSASLSEGKRCILEIINVGRQRQGSEGVERQ